MEPKEIQKLIDEYYELEKDREHIEKLRSHDDVFYKKYYEEHNKKILATIDSRLEEIKQTSLILKEPTGIILDASGVRYYMKHGDLRRKSSRRYCNTQVRRVIDNSPNLVDHRFYISEVPFSPDISYYINIPGFKYVINSNTTLEFIKRILAPLDPRVSLQEFFPCEVVEIIMSYLICKGMCENCYKNNKLCLLNPNIMYFYYSILSFTPMKNDQFLWNISLQYTPNVYEEGIKKI